MKFSISVGYITDFSPTSTTSKSLRLAAEALRTKQFQNGRLKRNKNRKKGKKKEKRKKNRISVNASLLPNWFRFPNVHCKATSASFNRSQQNSNKQTEHTSCNKNR